ncbi:MAG: hypothetical protein NVS4B7_16190 [Ktedonobacteraceae bacterium]
MKSKVVIYTFFYAITLVMVVLTVLAHGHQDKHRLLLLIMSVGMSLIALTWVLKSTIYMVLSPWYTYTIMQKKRQHYTPLVSVIIPAWNEEVGLVATIKTVLASSYRPMEIVIVNDGSTDRTDQMVRTFIKKYTEAMTEADQYIPLIYQYQKNGGKGSALNTGITLSRGEIIVTFDADCVVHQDAITSFVSYFTDPKVMAAAGNIKIGNTRNILGVIQSLEYMFGFHLKRAEVILGLVFVIGGAAAAFRREVFMKLGDYNTNMITEDMDLSLRIQAAGMKIVYVPEAIVHTEGPSDMQGLMRQRLRWKRGRMEAFHIHKSFFFSTKKQVNKPFFWITLPLVILEDIQGILAAIFIILIYLYSFLSNNFLVLFATMLLVTVTYFILFCEDKEYRKLSYLLLTPIVWYLLHLATFVELYALFTALWTFYRKREVKWQVWKRKGVADF